MEKWIESSYEAEGPLYWTTMSVLLHSGQQWNIHRLAHLRRLFILAHARHCQPSGPAKSISDKSVKEYSVYKPYLIFFGLVDGLYKYFFKVSLIFVFLNFEYRWLNETFLLRFPKTAQKSLHGIFTIKISNILPNLYFLLMSVEVPKLDTFWVNFQTSVEVNEN